MFKLYSKNIPRHLWHLLYNWYNEPSSSVLWDSCVSLLARVFVKVLILSPLLYSLYVDNLLNTLSGSGHGVYTDDIFCGAPMSSFLLVMLWYLFTLPHSTSLSVFRSYSVVVNCGLSPSPS